MCAWTGLPLRAPATFQIWCTGGAPAAASLSHSPVPFLPFAGAAGLGCRGGGQFRRAPGQGGHPGAGPGGCAEGRQVRSRHRPAGQGGSGGAAKDRQAAAGATFTLACRLQGPRSADLALQHWDHSAVLADRQTSVCTFPATVWHSMFRRKSRRWKRPRLTHPPGWLPPSRRRQRRQR